MKIILPKELRGFAYDRVLPVELNDFNVEILLPSVFFKVLSGGRDRGKINNDPAHIRQYLLALAKHPRMQGFGGEQGMRTLDRLVRCTLIQTAHQGASRKTEQIQGFTGYTLLTAKPGFPKEISTLRKVDQLIYRMMRDQFGGEGELRRFFTEIFGAGLQIEHGLEIGGGYDGHTDLDTLTLLSVCFLDGFTAVGVKQRSRDERPIREACPPIAQSMARDVRRYLQAYHRLMPAEALSYHLKSLINFELLIYSLKLFDSITSLVSDHDVLPEGMHPNPEHTPGATRPQLYLDFTGAASGASREMAVASVRDCLDLVQHFVRANLQLRQLDAYVRALRNSKRVRQQVERVLTADNNGAGYLQALVQLLDDQEIAREIDASARQDIEAIHRENLSPSREEGDRGEPNPIIDAIIEPAMTDFEALVLLLAEGQEQKIGDRVIRWFYSVGGLAKPYGMLAGTTKGRGQHGWRFAPTNDCLSTLVQLAAVNLGRWDKEAPAPNSFPVSSFLEFLETRFGILVDRPLDRFAGAEYTAAARENLRAMLRRLGQMGVFRDLSDDFTVQRLTPPYTVEREGVDA